MVIDKRLNKKVCCKDCYYRGNFSPEFCFCNPDGIVYYGSGTKKSSCILDRNVVRCYVRNSDGECKQYKRKWWKFWIKEK